jgi:hypothetical protein
VWPARKRVPPGHRFGSDRSRSHSGTGSAPRGPRGRHRSSRRPASRLPRSAPCRSTACAAYSEQLGVNLHTGRRGALISRWYTLTAATTRMDAADRQPAAAEVRAGAVDSAWANCGSRRTDASRQLSSSDSARQHPVSGVVGRVTTPTPGHGRSVPCRAESHTACRGSHPRDGRARPPPECRAGPGRARRRRRPEPGRRTGRGTGAARSGPTRRVDGRYVEPSSEPWWTEPTAVVSADPRMWGLW